MAQAITICDRRMGASLVELQVVIIKVEQVVEMVHFAIVDTMHSL